MNDTKPLPADSALPHWLASLPEGLRPYAMLARWDRPVGIWLLYLPCLIGLCFSRHGTGLAWIDVMWALLFLLGATAMRGAGCTWNDITDREFDGKVERTASRPLPAGLISLNQAYLFLGTQLLIGFFVWLALPLDAKIIALLSIPLVVAYPFMKRVTWWPQAWLGMTFNWGVLVGAATASIITLPVIVLYLGLILWTIAYDTIYALQDREDDALIGVRSTARLFGDNAVTISFFFHIASAAMIAAAAAMQGLATFGAMTAIAFLAHGAWQAWTLVKTRERAALNMFKSNVWAGALVAAGFAVAAMLAPTAPPSAPTSASPAASQSPSSDDSQRVWLASDILVSLQEAGIAPSDARESPDQE